MSIQPWTGTERLIVEARGEGGALRFDCEQPPTKYLNTDLDTLYCAMWRELPEAVGTWESLNDWLRSKSWTVRRRNW